LPVIYKQVAPLELKYRAVSRAVSHAEPRADALAVIRANDLQKNGSDAEMVCRNELQKPCRKNAPMQYCLQMQYVVQNCLQNPLQMSVQYSVQ
jgi:hypothetical protein